MKYYINKQQEIFAFEEDGSQDFLIKKDMKPISKEEIQAINKAKEDEYKDSIEYKINEAKKYLIDTDYKMTIDYDKDVAEVKIKRAEAREFIRANQGVTDGL